ncbi:MAG: hypothetical protein AB7V25_00785 [Mangrovibacterium sp.]
MNLKKHIPKLSDRSRPFLKGMAILAGLVALQYSFFSVKSVRDRMKAVNSQVEVQLLTPAEVEKDTSWLRLYKEKDWLETRLQIARTDSISLSVNLQDSSLQIELKGVVLKKTKMLDYKADKFLYKLNPAAYHHMMGKQAKASEVIASIPKEPLIIKKAPKDTLEAEATAETIDSTKIEVVHWMMKLDNQLVIKIEGVDPLSKDGWWASRKFWMVQNLQQTTRDFTKALLFKTPEYDPEIKLLIPEADAKAFYRALPVQPLVCIRL